MIKMGRRLRAGDRGPEVAFLQESLAALGFSGGPVDGIFGIWTEDGLRELQRSYGLRVDGVAGEEVWRLLQDPGLRPQQKRYRLGRGQTLRQVAEKFHVAEGVIRHANGLHDEEDLYPGRELIIPCREVWARIDGGLDLDQYLSSLTRHRHGLTGILAPWFAVSAEGEVEERIQTELLNWIRRHGLGAVAHVILPPRWEGRGRKKAMLVLRRFCRDFRLTGLLAGAEAWEKVAAVTGFLREVQEGLEPWFLTMVDLSGPSCGPFSSEMREGAYLDLGSRGAIPNRLCLALPLEVGVPSFQRLLAMDGRGFNPAWGKLIHYVLRRRWGGVVLSGIGRESERIWRLLGQEFAPTPAYFVLPRILFDRHQRGGSVRQKGEVWDGNLPAGKEAAGGGGHW